MNLLDQFDKIKLTMINKYISEKQDENLNLDFKMLNSIDLSNKDDKKNFAKALSGFANSNGGIIVWGVDCRKNDDNVDCASKIKEIENVDVLLTRLNELTGEAVTPLIGDIKHKKIYTTKPKGIAVSFCPESDVGPHMAKLGEDRYYKRSGDSFYRMEHFDIADMFGRRHKPYLRLDYIIDYLNRITIRIRNDGRATAVAPYLRVELPELYGISMYGFDDNNNWNIPLSLRSGNRRDFRGTAQHVIHPGTVMEVFILKSAGDKAIVDTVGIKYGIASMNMPLKEDALTIDPKR